MKVHLLILGSLLVGASTAQASPSQEEKYHTPPADPTLSAPRDPARTVAPGSAVGEPAGASLPTSDKGGTFDAHKGRDDFGQGGSQSWPSDKGGAVRGSANWNPSDDLLPDGGVRGASEVIINNDASLEGAIGKASPRDASSQKDLNASRQLEKNIAGEYELPEEKRKEFHPLPQGLGVPGSVQSGTISSGDSERKTERGRDQTPTGAEVFGNETSYGEGSANPLDLELARRVKSTLTRESTGTHGAMAHEVARDVQVTSKDGIVTLQGKVSSTQNKDLLEIRAREIRGVKRVENELVVTPDEEVAHPSVNRGKDLEDTTDRLQDKVD
jgi:hypothetical protein